MNHLWKDDNKVTISDDNNIIIINNKKIDYDKYVKTYKGLRISIFKKNKKAKNVLVFDLDETLGSFIDLNILWLHLNNHINFNDLLDIFPEFLRFGILNILQFVYNQKILGFCYKIFIYTNNKCFYNYVDLISKYFSYKLGCENVFDQIIRSFKIGNKIIEIRRTTSEKTYNDFIRCTLLPKKTKICFIDNSYFSSMVTSRVYYIQPTLYHHHLSKEDITYRISKFIFNKSLLNEIYDSLLTFTNYNMRNNWGYIEYKKKIDICVAYKMMYHIKDFFYLTKYNNKTKKKWKMRGRYTRKIKSSLNVNINNVFDK